jgi:hypothetical protein
MSLSSCDILRRVSLADHIQHYVDRRRPLPGLRCVSCDDCRVLTATPLSGGAGSLLRRCFLDGAERRQGELTRTIYLQYTMQQAAEQPSTSAGTDPERSPLAKVAARLLHRRMKVRHLPMRSSSHPTTLNVQRVRPGLARTRCAGACQGRQGAGRGVDVPRQAGQHHPVQHARAARGRVSAGGSPPCTAAAHWPCTARRGCRPPSPAAPCCRLRQKSMGQVLISAAHRASCEVEVRSSAPPSRQAAAPAVPAPAQLPW